MMEVVRLVNLASRAVDERHVPRLKRNQLADYHETHYEGRGLEMDTRVLWLEITFATYLTRQTSEC